MTLRRDDWHDYVTRHEVMDAGRYNDLLRQRVRALAKSSGLRNTPNVGNITVHEDICYDAVQITVWASSSKWTGRPRGTRIDLKAAAERVKRRFPRILAALARLG